jgi:16S rRNA (cytosine967-C5)-methyltransferase
VTLRVNPRQIGRAEFVQSVAAAYADAGLKFITPDNTLAVMLDRSLDVTHLPGYEQGHFSVQDLAAQHAAALLAPASGASILDACAAPGGKTAHLLELADVQVTAIDQDERRLERLGVNLSRLQLDTLPQAGGQIIAGDAANLEAWWDGVPFDHVLLDAPCSASGIVRRHPDVRWLRKRSDLATLAEQQTRLLDALWPVLKPGGTLLYITCSVFRAEGAAVIDQFLARTPEAKPLPMQTGCLEFSAERALLPSADHDGFYFCLLQRQPAQE